MSALVLAAIFVTAIVIAAAPRAQKACSDGNDNDGDGYIDLNDPGCANKNDLSELDPNVECDDGSDNDGDSAIDYNDDGCSGPTDNDETNCGDSVCEGGETSGTCPEDCGYPDSCSDTDGGNYPSTFGTTSGYYNNNPYNNDDYCVDTSNIMEYYCNGDYEQSSQQSCGADGYGSSYCNGSSVYRDLTDYFCSDGLCDYTITPELVETCLSPEECVSGACVIPDSCSDTDGGWIFDVKGVASGYLSEVSYNSTDFCLDSATIVEYSCFGDYAYNTTISCLDLNATSCSDGECI
ncbi:hypothetical protein KY366_05845 [Candidatus Woesearchaeota archaeon]|nr:hypothetical protein [Candidatus Woesearchaeota archaeon]